jgi:phosphoribosylanthranilate isomerase
VVLAKGRGESAPSRVKICGITSVADAKRCVALGADALGLNFWPKSVRRCDESVARAIAEAVGKSTLLVGVFVDESAAEIARLIAAVSLGCVQLHGAEEPEFVARFLPHAYKALRVRGSDVREEVQRYPGEHILLDAYVAGMPGGTGATFDWQIGASIAATRKLTLAGGLTPDNVAEAVRVVRPYCVDTASGVERAPGIKDEALVRTFIERAKSA